MNFYGILITFLAVGIANQAEASSSIFSGPSQQQQPQILQQDLLQQQQNEILQLKQTIVELQQQLQQLQPQPQPQPHSLSSLVNQTPTLIDNKTKNPSISVKLGVPGLERKKQENNINLALSLLGMILGGK